MNSSQIQDILSAVESAEITDCRFVSENNVSYYKSESSILKFDSGKEILWAIGLAPKMGSLAGNNAIIMTGADPDSVKEFRLNGDFDTIKKFADALGVEISNEEEKLLRQIDINNIVVKPQTGDYSNIFHILSPEEIEALTPEEKEEYEEHVKKEEERLKLPKGVPCRID